MYKFTYVVQFLSNDGSEVLEDFINWLEFWAANGYPIGLNTRFLIDR